MRIPGWTSEAQQSFLMRAISALPDESLIVEIGVWQGRSALSMAEACRGTAKKVFAVDPWVDYTQSGLPISDRLHEWGVRSFDQNYEVFRHYCRRFALDPWIRTCRMSSLEAASQWSHGPVDMVFIDGNHDYGAVLSDLNAWVPRVRVGGTICGDDWEWDSVRAAVQDYLSGDSESRLELPVPNTWAFRR